MSDLTDKLGFYYVVFQRMMDDNYIKCWIDGNEDYEIYTQEELLNFCNILGIDSEMTVRLKNAFCETSIFLWDVEDRKVRRLSPSYEPPTKDIFAAVKDKPKVSFKEGYISYEDGRISLENGRPY